MPPDYQARRVLSIAHDALRAQADRNHRLEVLYHPADWR